MQEEEMEKSENIKETLKGFNQSVKGYLKKHLNTIGENEILENIFFHIGICPTEKKGDPLVISSYKENADSTKNTGAELYIVKYCDANGCTDEKSDKAKVRKEIEVEIIADADREEFLNEAKWKEWTKAQEVIMVSRSEMNNSLKTNEENIDDIKTVSFVMVVGITKECKLQDRLIAQTILELLTEGQSDLKFLQGIADILKKKEEENSLDLMSRYVKSVFWKLKEMGYATLSYEECHTLSHTFYERQANYGKICLGWKNGAELKGKATEEPSIILFQDSWKKMMHKGKEEKGASDGEKEQEIQKKGKMRYYRKLLEMSQENDWYLITGFEEKQEGMELKIDEEPEVDLFGLAHKTWLDKNSGIDNSYSFVIQFKGYGDWEIWDENEQLLVFEKDTPYYSGSSMDKGIENEFKEMVTIADEEEGKIIQPILRIVEEIRTQEHGTGIIFFPPPPKKQDDKSADTSKEQNEEKKNETEISNNPEKEAERLCTDCHRGFRLKEKVNLSVGLEQEKSGKKEKTLNQKLLKGLTSIDGVLLADYAGNCYAFGVILDGKASKHGSPAKGARHNSLLAYIEEREGCIAVVVSEDKHIEIQCSKDIDNRLIGTKNKKDE